MNAWNRLSLFLILLFPLLAADRASTTSTSEWEVAVRQAQSQLREGKFSGAIASAQRSLKLAREAGADAKVANSYFLLGLIHHDWAHCAESRSNYVLAIATLRRQSDPDVEHIFNAEFTLISGLCECEDFEAARNTFRTYQPDLVKYARGAIGQARLSHWRPPFSTVAGSMQGPRDCSWKLSIWKRRRRPLRYNSRSITAPYPQFC